MDPKDLARLLQSVSKGRTTVDAAIARLRDLPFENIGYARIDHHRGLRRGYPEIVFGQGKTAEQCSGIVDRVARAGQTVIVTRASRAQFERISGNHPAAVWHEAARMITLAGGEEGNRARKRRGGGKGARTPRGDDSTRRGVGKPSPTAGRILVMTAGTSDIPVAEEAAVTAEMLGAKVDRVYDVGVAGLHRLLGVRPRMSKADVIIVVAGMEGALPSVVAGLVGIPVIGVPTSTGYGAAWGGLTALFGMLTSCAGGLTVVNIDNGFGAAYAAAMMLKR